MVTQSGLTSLVILTVLLAGCDGGSSSGSSAATSTSSSTSTDATSASSPSVTSTGDGTATLTWIAPTQNTNGTPLTNLAGYHIYYGTSPNNLASSVQIADANTTSYTINGLAAGTWYFSINAYTSAGVESAISNVASKTIP